MNHPDDDLPLRFLLSANQITPLSPYVNHTIVTLAIIDNRLEKNGMS